MAPLLWSSFKLKTTGQSHRSIDDLISPNGKIVPNIRSLVVEQGEDYNLNLLALALEPHSLRKLVVYGFMKSLTFLHLLRMQCHLRTVAVDLDFSDLPSNTTQAAWFQMHTGLLRGSFSKVESLQLSFSRDRKRFDSTRAQARWFLECAPNLDSLFLDLETKVWDRPFRSSDYTFDEDPFDLVFSPRVFSMLPSDPPFLKLKSLHLLLVDFERTKPETALGDIDLRNLQSLRLENCFPLAPFFGHLSSSIRKLGNDARLSSVEVVLVTDDSEDPALEAVETLLESATGLQKICVDVCQEGYLNASCITRHHKTLRYLALYSQFGIHGSHPIDDVRSIVEKCPQLEQLGIELPDTMLESADDPNMFYNDQERLLWSLERDTHLPAILQIIAKAPNLHTFRSFSLQFTHYDPVGWGTRQNRLGKPYIVHLVKAVATNFADQVLKHLIQHGSKIKVRKSFH
jgi:aryl carrier-like protein